MKLAPIWTNKNFKKKVDKSDWLDILGPSESICKGSDWHLRSRLPGFDFLVWKQHQNSQQKLGVKIS